MTVIPQNFPLFVIHLGSDGKNCRVFPGVHVVLAWDHFNGPPAVPNPIMAGLAGAEDPGDEAFTRRFFHSYEAASAYIAQEQATPPHGAGH